jgi:hypothetical protein
MYEMPKNQGKTTNKSRKCNYAKKDIFLIGQLCRIKDVNYFLFVKFSLKLFVGMQNEKKIFRFYINRLRANSLLYNKLFGKI